MNTQTTVSFHELDDMDQLWLKNLAGSSKYGAWDRGMPHHLARMATYGYAIAHPEQGHAGGYKITVEGLAYLRELERRRRDKDKAREEIEAYDYGDDYSDDY